MNANPLRLVSEYGQSLWLDNLTRRMIRDGRLRRLIEEDGISGVTSNPAIFHKAMTEGTEYDDTLGELARKGLPAAAIYEALAVLDVQAACDLLRAIHERTNGTDGFVSLEVSPLLARDTEGTVTEARRLWAAVDRPNVFIKIPGTPEGIPAVRRCLAEGININITLLFSLDAYRKVMEAHLAALEERTERKLPLASVASVASFFLSRIDTLVDKRLDAMKAQGAHAESASVLRGRAAIASAKIAYTMWKEVYSGARWEALRGQGARVQKPLWASTSTKDPTYPDVMYVEALIGPYTVNTLPDQTVDAFRDHGRVANTLEANLDAERQVLSRLERLGISMKEITDILTEEGIAKFAEPYESLLHALDEKRRNLAAIR